MAAKKTRIVTKPDKLILSEMITIIAALDQYIDRHKGGSSVWNARTARRKLRQQLALAGQYDRDEAAR